MRPTRAQHLRSSRRIAAASFNAYDQDHAGHPLGTGMPPGAPIRADGESHRQAWMQVVRHDPCAYCMAPAATVDHIEPRGRPAHPKSIGGHHIWLNYTASCHGCNGTKGTKSLLEMLYRRRWGRAITPGR